MHRGNSVWIAPLFSGARASTLALVLLLVASIACAQLRIELGSPDRVTWNGRRFGQAEQISFLRWGGVELSVVDMADLPVGRRSAASARPALRGVCARLDVGLPSGEYDVLVELAESPNCCQGTVDVLLQGEPAIHLPPSESGQARRGTAKVELSRGPLQLFFKPDAGTDVAITSVEVQSTGGDTLGFPLLLPERRVPRSDGAQIDSVHTADDRLHALVDYLERYRISTGLFDYTSAAWWEAGLSVHALLLAGELTADPGALTLAVPVLDLLVARQDADGGFCAYAYALARDVQPHPMTPCDTRNVADLGVATACLSLAAPLVDTERGERYLAAHRRFIDEFASRYRLPSGAFANGLFEGAIDSTAYSVATATIAMSMSALHERTGEPRYLRWAEDAAGFLARAWSADGRPLFYPHRPLPPHPLDLEEWNDLYYLLEGLLWVREVTNDDELQREIDHALHDCVYGEKGLLAIHPASELPVLRRERRAQAKVNGMAAVLFSLRGVLGPEPRLDTMIENTRASLLESDRALDREIFARPYDQTGVEAIVATSFAGLAFAEMISPGSAFRAIRPAP